MDLSAIRFATCLNYLHWTQTQTFLLKNFETLDTIYCYPQKIENFCFGKFLELTAFLFFKCTDKCTVHPFLGILEV